MSREHNSPELLSEFLSYLVNHEQAEDQSLPSLADLSQELGIGIAALREQLEVARALGLVEVRPRIGIRRKAYAFLPAVRQSLAYALALDKTHFQAFADLRKHIEMTYWHEAVQKLTAEDRSALNNVIRRAWEKLRGTPAQIPHAEHRELHLIIYRRLENPFVTGLLEAYWEAYEAVGLNVYADYHYLEDVWGYHQKMVEAICNQDYEAGYHTLLEHTDLITQRPPSAT